MTRGGDSVFAKRVKKRGELEKEYAKNIRKLVTKYDHKTGQDKKQEETSYNKSFRMILREMGFQAGQLELLAESFGKIIPRQIENKIKEAEMTRHEHTSTSAWTTNSTTRETSSPCTCTSTTTLI